ncbi:hypothetical protein LDENG_00208950 [Lucifuga dentata]|nr:hypothetical protein LDENG_00208950 [Lucifuga dentata]
MLLQLLTPMHRPTAVCLPGEGGVKDAIIYLLHRAHSHLDQGSGAVRIIFFDFSSTFNTIQSFLLRDKLTEMGVDSHLVTWITGYLTGRPQYVRLKDCSSETVLSPVLFTLYTSVFRYNPESCHVQKYSDDPEIVGCIRGGKEGEYRSTVEDFESGQRLMVSKFKSQTTELKDVACQKAILAKNTNGRY